MRFFSYILLLALTTAFTTCKKSKAQMQTNEVAKSVMTETVAKTDTLPKPRLDSIVPEEDEPTIRYDYDTSQWTELTLEQHGIHMDLRYATANNFMKQQIYDCGRCFYRKNVAAALIKVQEELAKDSLGLKMYDCYRPAPYQQRLWDILPDARYVARPSKGSLHSRGAAADLTIIRLADGQELDMGTAFDFFGVEAYTTTTNLPKEVLENRALFQKVMRKNGFGTIRTEWWHFNYLGPRLPLADWVWNCHM